MPPPHLIETDAESACDDRFTTTRATAVATAGLEPIKLLPQGGQYNCFNSNTLDAFLRYIDSKIETAQGRNRMTSRTYERTVEFARNPALRPMYADREDRRIYYRARRDWYWYDAEGEERGLYRRPKKPSQR